MKLSEIIPDIVLAVLLDGKITVRLSATKSRDVRVYAEAEQPQTGLGDEFIRVHSNGIPAPTSRGRSGFGNWNGSLLVEILCKSNSDGTIKRNRNNSLISQIEDILGMGVTNGRFFFRLDDSNPVTPPTPNLTNGYYTTVLNVWWRTRPNEL